MPSLLRSSRRLQSLRLAKTHHDYVRVTRSIEKADPIPGYVVEVGTDWLLMNVVDAGLANGWVALQIADVDGIDVAPEGRFVRRGLEARQAWPPTSPEPALALSDGVRGLVDSAQQHFSPAALFTERLHRVDFSLGRAVRWTAQGLEWQELGRDATWADEPEFYESSAITRLDIGGRYATALARVADLRGAD